MSNPTIGGGNPPVGGGNPPVGGDKAPAPGTYHIFSRVLDENGHKLAMTFNGDKEPITVTPLDTSNTKQRWVIQDYNSELQHVKPQDNQSLEAGWGATIYTLPVGNYVWNIRPDNGYVIKNGGKTISWSLNEAKSNTPVVPLEDSQKSEQRWIFHPVDAPLP